MYNIKSNKSRELQISNCKVNDTGKLYGIAVDLSRKAFASIANLQRGVIKVSIQVIGFEKIKNY